MKNFLRMANGEWRITATFRAIRHLLSSILVSNPPRHPLALGLASETRPGAPESRRLRAPGFLFGLLAAGFWLLASAPAAPAAVMYGIFTNSVGNADTNYVKLIQLSGPTANADGSFNTVGLPIRVTPAADGRWTNTLVTGNWLVTNSFLGKGIAFRAPLDNGPTPHNIYSNLISGYNTYVTLVFGTNPPPTYDEITNALGILPLTPAQVTNAAAQQALFATNTLNTHLQNTNSALVTRLNATNDLILARLEATNLLTRAALTATNDLILAQIVIAASTNGVSAATATNIAKYQAQLATNTLAQLTLAQSNSLLAYLIATNTSVLGKVNADSNSLLAYLIATNVSLRTFATNAAVYQAAIATNDLAANLAGKLGTNAAAARVTSAVTNQWKLDATNAINTLAVKNALTNGNQSQAILGGGLAITNGNSTIEGVLTIEAVTALPNLAGNILQSSDGDNGAITALGVTSPLVYNNSLGTLGFDLTAATNAAITQAALVTNNLPALLAGKMNTNAPLWRASTNDLSSATNIAFNGLAPDARQTITNLAAGIISQTPWLGDINAAGYSLTNAGNGIFTNTLTVGNSTYITAAGRIRASGGGGLNNFVGGDDSLTLSISSDYDALVGGYHNSIGGNSDNNGIIGGQYNSIGTTLNNYGQYSFIGGGFSNQIVEPNGTAQYSAIVGGRNNRVTADYGYAAGYGAAVSNNGAFVWADSQGTTFGSVISNSFLVRAQNGVAINTNDPSGHAVKVIGNVDSSSGTAGRYTAANFNVGGNPLATTSTNYLALRGAGTTSANGSYTWTGSLYTNKITTGYVVLIAGVWYAKSADGTINYSASGSVSNGAWTQVSGSLPVPASTFGSAINLDGNVWEGAISSTNFEARLAAITAGGGASLTDATNAAQTVVSNIIKGSVRLTLWDGTVTNFQALADTDLGRGAALTNAIFYHTTNSVIEVGSGKFEISGSYNFTNNVVVKGQGQSETIIYNTTTNTTAFTYRSNFNIFNLWLTNSYTNITCLIDKFIVTDSSAIPGFVMRGVRVSHVGAFAISSNRRIINPIIDNCWFESYHGDGVHYAVVDNALVQNCIFDDGQYVGFETVNSDSSSVVQNCIFRSLTSSNVQHISVSGISTIKGCLITTVNTHTNFSYPVTGIIAGLGTSVTVLDTKIFTSTVNNTNYDLFNSSSLTPIYVNAATVYNPATVSGSVYNLWGSFTGNGAGLTNLPASAVNLSSSNNYFGRFFGSGTESLFTNNIVGLGTSNYFGGIFKVAGTSTLFDTTTTPLKIQSSSAVLSLISFYINGSTLKGYFGANTNGLCILGANGTDSNFTINGTTGAAAFRSTLSASNGFASFSTVGPVNIAASGWTNIWSTNMARVIFDGTAMTYSIVRANGTGLYTNPVAVAHASETLQPGNWLLISGTGVTGSAFGF